MSNRIKLLLFPLHANIFSVSPKAGEGKTQDKNQNSSTGPPEKNGFVTTFVGGLTPKRWYFYKHYHKIFLSNTFANVFFPTITDTFMVTYIHAVGWFKPWNVSAIFIATDYYSHHSDKHALSSRVKSEVLHRSFSEKGRHSLKTLGKMLSLTYLAAVAQIKPVRVQWRPLSKKVKLNLVAVSLQDHKY